MTLSLCKTNEGLAVGSPKPFARLSGMVERVRPWLPSMIGLVGAYLNMVVYGFQYGVGNHEFELPLVNLLRDPSLYPNDPIREGLVRLPSLFWPLVAELSRWVSTEHVLFLFFLLTKVLFFIAVARLGIRRVNDYRLVACIVLAVAFSPLLETFTPFGTSDVLDSVQTHTSLAIAVLLWVGVFLLEGRWITAVLISGLTIYISPLAVVHALFAFLVFAAVDWRRRRSKVLLGALLGLVMTSPALALWHGISSTPVPKDFVRALLMLEPRHLTLQGHSAHDLIYGTGLLVAALLMALVARKAGLRSELRLEALALSYFVPAALGAFCGQFLLTPNLARLQFLRADSFLILYSVLLIQIYGANLLLCEQTTRPRTTLFLGGLAILLPLSGSLGLLWPLFVAMLFWADPKPRFEALCQRLACSREVQMLGLSFLLLGFFIAVAAAWSSTWVLIPALAGGYLFAYGGPSAIVSTRMSRLAFSLCCTAAVLVAIDNAPGPSNLWNPVIRPGRIAADWFEVQRWAKDHTSKNAQFLVPTFPGDFRTFAGGFRVFSQRSSWGEWKDGSVVYLFPPFADIYRQRMEALGLSWDSRWYAWDVLQANYKHQSWEHLLAVARANHLDYIIQFRDVPYPVSPVFANPSYAVYKVPQ